MVIAGNPNRDKGPWKDLNVARWASTKRNVHMYAQMLGKMRLGLSPPQPNWMNTALYLHSRGLTTSAMPWKESSVEASIDVFSSEIAIARSDGDVEKIALLPARSVAEIYEEVCSALDRLGIVCPISPKPQEVPDTTPFNEDRRSGEYDPAAVVRWFETATATAGIFDRSRARFFGRSGVQVWWGALDVALVLFSGKRVAAPTDRGYLMKYDLDAELMNVGFYLGDERTAPFFFGYIYPQPENAPTLSIAPDAASWSAQLGEWVLPYEDVRNAHDPGSVVSTFAESIYERCFTAAGWDRETLSYVAPKASRPK